MGHYVIGALAMWATLALLGSIRKRSTMNSKVPTEESVVAVISRD